jgi:hypothetical protein
VNGEPEKPHSRNPLDLGIGNWIQQHIPDPRVRAALLIMVALVLIGPLAVHSLGSLGTALETLLLVIVIFFAALFVLVMAVAVFPVGDQSTATKTLAARQAQRNARASLLLLAGVGAGAVIAVNLFVVPIWENVHFQFAFQRLKWNAIDLPAFFADVDLAQASGEAVTQSNIADQDESELPFTSDGRISDTQTLLRLIARRRAAVISGKIKLNPVPDRHIALIAAEQVTFARGSSLELGSTTLVVAAASVVVEPDASIVAFEPGDVPSNAGLAFSSKGVQGGKSGDLRIVLLNSISGTGKVSVDLRGQQGGQGAPGEVYRPRPPSGDAPALEGRPRWEFRPLGPDEIKHIEDEFTRERPFLIGSPRTLPTAILSAQTLQTCHAKSGSCVAVVCAEDLGSWANDSRGRAGETGDKGGNGGAGGHSGTPGSFTLFYLAGTALKSDDIALKFAWVDGSEIALAPKPQKGGQPGEGGKGGSGGAGGRGLAADPLGACPSGVSGEPGHDGPPGKTGDPGEETQGVAARFIRLTPLFGRAQ